ncbi:hypothetical protein [Orlajensenia leifsoniae]|uniref:Uncharacterized protein n=1 Tax=Orlajensenia leifsoniae TaxID=2561933 RepID=A0A4Y9QSF8_9MICO|nr:hypothetical protein [Leifsonia flava]TFV94066.1 hypothetical protein E4M00_17465 [Leifsonia flava]
MTERRLTLACPRCASTANVGVAVVPTMGDSGLAVVDYDCRADAATTTSARPSTPPSASVATSADGFRDAAVTCSGATHLRRSSLGITPHRRGRGPTGAS